MHPANKLSVTVIFHSLVFLILSIFITSQTMAAISADEKAQTVVHMLDYISVDYPEFVKNGKVLNQSEFEEQLEFSTQALTLLKEMPANAEQSILLDKGQVLRSAINSKVDGGEVSKQANALRADVIRVYKVAVTPKSTPNLLKASQLYAANCAVCHGATGRGDGPLSKGMDPQPSDFHEEARMKVRSIYGLYNTIALGVAGTPMRPFTEITEEDRWALAFFVGTLRHTQEDVNQGESAWNNGEGKKDFQNLRALATQTPDEVEQQGGKSLVQVQAYLTSHPEAIKVAGPSPLDVSREKLVQSLAAYQAGDAGAARQLAITAYLEGFELVESSLDNTDGALRQKIELEMMALRAAISAGKPVEEVSKQVKVIEALLNQADEALSENLSATTAFISALLILLREGLEAILVLAAIISFVVKTGRRDALRYIHYGWIAAVALGILTWVVANYVLTISGANRELTEGITALVAAIMLLYVGYWLHSKSYAQAWQKFIREHVTAALEKKTMWAMASVSFLAVYRELFEIILFYQALWVQVGDDGHVAVLSGVGAAAILLAVIGWAILKYSIRLPIGPFFGVTSGLLALLAVVFAGNGIAALQEAGVIEADRINFVTVPLLGVHPTMQGITTQAIILALVMIGIWMSRRQAKSV
ncbi:putative cytochrome c, class I:Iron permease FTR1 precursor [Herminiimonas arsenicoxydans]|uniref:Cytochrome c, class I:Iron permease FTR1 n=1 Tax=Herminiimonas arsenicoxydans TaxID=204773 RepID=A4G5G9_HERAR|nr:putative cytochrome c, class I:Iron permease FTR1 precursor [Herminiimonas arsenicoxydans]